MNGFLNPNKILDELDLREDMTAAEFGCGSGNFTIALAKRLIGGRVYGLDVQAEALSALQGQARTERLSNIETIHCDLEQKGGSTLPNDFIDLVLIPNVLFQAEDKETIIKEAVRILKIGGHVLIIDWKKESRLGPKTGRVFPEQLKEISAKLGLKLKKEFDAGSFHYALLFEKP